MTARFVARVANFEPRFKVKTLPLALTLLSAAMAMPAFALVAIDESILSDATAEGIAFLPENTSLVFQSAGTKPTDVNGVTTDAVGIATASPGTRSQDTGYIRIIPVGPLTQQAIDSGAGKADVFLYGLAVSRGDSDANNRFGGAIASWGTASNTWLLGVATKTGVEDFSLSSNPKPVSYLSIEAPLRNLFNQMPTTAATGADAYNLKMGFWADAFVRDPAVKEDMSATGTQFNVGGANRANRLRLQAVMDGFSINGTRIQAFQTLGGAPTEPSYNNTLGLAGVVRLNSGDTRSSGAYKITAGNPTVDRSVYVTNRYSSTFTDMPSKDLPSLKASSLYRVRSIDTVDTITGSSYSVPTNLSVLRLSTQETTDTGLLATPAIGAVIGSAPTFNATEGLFVYGLNANIVLGSLAQPLIFGKDPSSNNLVFELTRIPNKPELYKQIYTDYSGADTSYKGSTCNAYQCGANQTLGATQYQGNTATHSSISIGTVNWSGAGYGSGQNLLTADSTASALGVSFGALQSSSAASTTVNRYYELQYEKRLKLATNAGTWAYCITATCGQYNGGGATNGGTPATLPAANYSLGQNPCTFSPDCNNWERATWLPVTASSAIAGIFPGYDPTLPHPAYYVDNQGNNNLGGDFASGATCAVIGNLSGVGFCGTTVAGNYGTNYINARPQSCNIGSNCTNGSTANTSAASWGPLVTQIASAGTPGAYISGGVWVSNTVPAIPSAPAASSAMNNFGSGVIDGLLIQHLKFTTKGL